MSSPRPDHSPSVVRSGVSVQPSVRRRRHPRGRTGSRQHGSQEGGRVHRRDRRSAGADESGQSQSRSRPGRAGTELIDRLCCCYRSSRASRKTASTTRSLIRSEWSLRMRREYIGQILHVWNDRADLTLSSVLVGRRRSPGQGRGTSRTSLREYLIPRYLHVVRC